MQSNARLGEGHGTTAFIINDHTQMPPVRWLKPQAQPFHMVLPKQHLVLRQGPHMSAIRFVILLDRQDAVGTTSATA